MQRNPTSDANKSLTSMTKSDPALMEIVTLVVQAKQQPALDLESTIIDKCKEMLLYEPKQNFEKNSCDVPKLFAQVYFEGEMDNKIKRAAFILMDSYLTKANKMANINNEKKAESLLFYLNSIAVILYYQRDTNILSQLDNVVCQLIGVLMELIGAIQETLKDISCEAIHPEVSQEEMSSRYQVALQIVARHLKFVSVMIDHVLANFSETPSKENLLFLKATAMYHLADLYYNDGEFLSKTIYSPNTVYQNAFVVCEELISVFVFGKNIRLDDQQFRALMGRAYYKRALCLAKFKELGFEMKGKESGKRIIYEDEIEKMLMTASAAGAFETDYYSAQFFLKNNRDPCRAVIFFIRMLSYEECMSKDESYFNWFYDEFKKMKFENKFHLPLLDKMHYAISKLFEKYHFDKKMIKNTSIDDACDLISLLITLVSYMSSSESEDWFTRNSLRKIERALRDIILKPSAMSFFNEFYLKHIAKLIALFNHADLVDEAVIAEKSSTEARKSDSEFVCGYEDVTDLSKLLYDSQALGLPRHIRHDFVTTLHKELENKGDTPDPGTRSLLSRWCYLSALHSLKKSDEEDGMSFYLSNEIKTNLILFFNNSDQAHHVASVYREASILENILNRQSGWRSNTYRGPLMKLIYANLLTFSLISLLQDQIQSLEMFQNAVDFYFNQMKKKNNFHDLLQFGDVLTGAKPFTPEMYRGFVGLHAQLKLINAVIADCFGFYLADYFFKIAIKDQSFKKTLLETANEFVNAALKCKINYYNSLGYELDEASSAESQAIEDRILTLQHNISKQLQQYQSTQSMASSKKKKVRTNSREISVAFYDDEESEYDKNDMPELLADNEEVLENTDSDADESDNEESPYPLINTSSHTCFGLTLIDILDRNEKGADKKLQETVITRVTTSENLASDKATTSSSKKRRRKRKAEEQATLSQQHSTITAPMLQPQQSHSLLCTDGLQAILPNQHGLHEITNIPMEVLTFSARLKAKGHRCLLTGSSIWQILLYGKIFPGTDYDFITTASALEVEELSGPKANRFGKDLCRYFQDDIQIDVMCNARAETLYAHALARDLTIGTFYLDIDDDDKKLYDPTKRALPDLKECKVLTIKPALESFTEDNTRVFAYVKKLQQFAQNSKYYPSVDALSSRSKEIKEVNSALRAITFHTDKDSLGHLQAKIAALFLNWDENYSLLLCKKTGLFGKLFPELKLDHPEIFNWLNKKITAVLEWSEKNRMIFYTILEHIIAAMVLNTAFLKNNKEKQISAIFSVVENNQILNHAYLELGKIRIDVIALRMKELQGSAWVMHRSMALSSSLPTLFHDPVAPNPVRVFGQRTRSQPKPPAKLRVLTH